MVVVQQRPYPFHIYFISNTQNYYYYYYYLKKLKFHIHICIHIPCVKMMHVFMWNFCAINGLCLLGSNWPNHKRRKQKLCGPPPQMKFKCLFGWTCNFIQKYSRNRHTHTLRSVFQLRGRLAATDGWTHSFPDSSKIWTEWNNYFLWDLGLLRTKSVA